MSKFKYHSHLFSKKVSLYCDDFNTLLTLSAQVMRTDNLMVCRPIRPRAFLPGYVVTLEPCDAAETKRRADWKKIELEADGMIKAIDKVIAKFNQRKL